MIVAGVVVAALLFLVYRRWVRVRRRRDTLTTTWADTTSGMPRGPRLFNPKPTLDLGPPLFQLGADRPARSATARGRSIVAVLNRRLW